MKIIVEGWGGEVIAALIGDYLGRRGLPVTPQNEVCGRASSLQRRAIQVGEQLSEPITIQCRGPEKKWVNHLEFDENISGLYPVVKGTFVTVGHIVSLVVDGYDEAGILKTHPELSAEDVRACYEYAVEMGELVDARG